MKDAQTILDEYEQGDMAQRMFMFLEHRSLREEFMVIDQKEFQADRACADQEAGIETRSFFSRVLAFIRSPCPAGCCAPKSAPN